MVVALLLAAVLATALLTLRLVDRPYVAPTPSAPDAAGDPAGAAAVLEDLEAALEGGLPSEAGALAPAGDTATADLLGALADNARRLRVRDLDLRYVDLVGVPGADGRWAVRADLSWSLRGFDTGTARTEVEVDLRTDQGRVAVLGFGSGRVPLWLRGPVLVDRAGDTVVVTAGADPARFSTLARRAVPQARRVLGDRVPRGPGGRLVVEVPADPTGLDSLLGVPDGTYRDVAAVTASVDGLLSDASPVHVFVNPEQLGRLRRTGAQVVMTHEAVHALTGAPTSRAPVWLVEGFADYVALRDVDLPVGRTAAQVLAQVRRDGLPERLPGEADFELAAAHLGAAYEAAWLACVAVADLVGEEALVDVYEATSAGESLAVALAAHDLDEADVTRAWRDLLRRSLR